MNVELLIAKSGDELQEKLTEFKRNSHIPSTSQYSGGKKRQSNRRK